ncbi:glycosyltransferase [Helicobacter sp. MIT 99-5507]|uniref:glycosyltransferase n=1 Tax=Helicobacter sp. MIT 99-5507 TaxID=152489 RepID=UPI000E1F6A9A|nr:glycosyltransferase [Helicobacter sp. MIT 99-5507]RDU58570.1 glycosyltransferase [Helicobacter sp. MIT 99-5507]
MDKISIITIVFNDINNIKKTLDSVINQTYENLQYIIIDGKSNDGTKEFIENKIKNISNITEEISNDDIYHLKATKKNNKNFTFYFISQKDHGIYDAMNKGIDLANGKWCNFMNCADKFYNSNAIYKVFEKFNTKKEQDNIKQPCVIYGNTQMVYDNTCSKILLASHNHKFHHKFIHQSSFIDTNIIKKYKFDTRFKIAGDTNLFTMLYNNGYKFLYIDEVISSFNLDGVSGKLSYQMFKEDCIIGYKYNKLYPLFNTLKVLFRDMPRYIIRISLPKKIRNKARVLISKKRI